jgi:membrane protease subunit (stomatin/prohibitin family)
MAVGMNMAGQVPQAAAVAAQTNDPAAKLQKLKTLFDQGLISQQDYEAKKAQILSQL